MLKHILPIALLLSTSLNAFADVYSGAKVCPRTDPTTGSAHSDFIQATLISGTLPQYPGYKGGVVCSYTANKSGIIQPYKSVPTPVTPSNWVGPISYKPTPYGPSLLLFACINADPQACAYNVPAERAE